MLVKLETIRQQKTVNNGGGGARGYIYISRAIEEPRLVKKRKNVITGTGGERK